MFEHNIDKRLLAYLKEIGLLEEEFVISGEYSFEPSEYKDIARAINGEPPYFHPELTTKEVAKTIVVDNWGIFEGLESECKLFGYAACQYNKTSLINFFAGIGIPILFCNDKNIYPLNDIASESKIAHLAAQTQHIDREQLYKLVAEKMNLSRNQVMIADYDFYQKMKIKNSSPLEEMNFNIEPSLALSAIKQLDEKEVKSFLPKNITSLMIDALSTPKEQNYLKECLKQFRNLDTLIFSNYLWDFELLKLFLKLEMNPDEKASCEKITTLTFQVHEHADESQIRNYMLPILKWIQKHNDLFKARFPNVKIITARNDKAHLQLPNEILQQLNNPGPYPLDYGDNYRGWPWTGHKNRETVIGFHRGVMIIDVAPTIILFKKEDLFAHKNNKALVVKYFEDSKESFGKAETKETDLPLFKNLRMLTTENCNWRHISLLLNQSPQINTWHCKNLNYVSSLTESKIMPNYNVNTIIIDSCQFSEDFARQLPLLFPNVEHIEFLNSWIKKTAEEKKEPLPIIFPKFDKLKSFNFSYSKYLGGSQEEIENTLKKFAGWIVPSVEHLNLHANGFSADFIKSIPATNLKNLQTLAIHDDELTDKKFSDIQESMPLDLKNISLQCGMSFTKELLAYIEANPHLKNLNLSYLSRTDLLEEFKKKFPAAYFPISYSDSEMSIREELSSDSLGKEAKKRSEIQKEDESVRKMSRSSSLPESKVAPDADTKWVNTIFNSEILFKTKSPSLNNPTLYRKVVCNKINHNAECYSESKWEPYHTYRVSENIKKEFEISESKDIAYTFMELTSGVINRLHSLSPNEKITHIQVHSADKNAKVELFFDNETRTYGAKVVSTAPVKLQYLIEVNRKMCDEKTELSPDQKKIIDECKAFTAGELKPEDQNLQGIELLEALKRNKKGACRHRSHCCFDELLKKGYKANLITNDSHVFVELQIGSEVVTVNLGGYRGILNTFTAVEEESKYTSDPATIENEKKSKDTFEEQQKKIELTKKERTATIVASILKKYEKPAITLSTATEKSFFDDLFKQPSDKPVMLTLPSANDIQALSNAASRYLKQKKQAYCFINNLDDFKSAEFKKFFNDTKNSSEETVLFLRWDKDKRLKPQHVGLNSLFDSIPTFESKELPKNLRIVPLIEESTELTEDIRSRLTHSRIIKLPDISFCKTENLKPGQIVLDEKKDRATLNLYEGLNWKNLLVGGFVTKDGENQFKPGVLLQLLRNSEEKKEGKAELPNLTVLNPPWYLPEFSVFWNKLWNERKILDEETNTYISLPENFSLSWATVPYVKPEEVEIKQFEEKNNAFDLILNQATFPHFFSRIAKKEDKLTQKPGYLQEYEAKPLSILVTEEMTKGQYQELYDQASKYRCRLKLLKTFPPKGVYDTPTPVKLKESGLHIIQAKDPSFYIDSILSKKPKPPIKFFLGPNSNYGLIERWFSTAENKDSNEEGAILKCLMAGQDVVLSGDFSPKLLKRLQTLFCQPPFLEFNGERLELGETKPLKGKIYLVAEKNPYSYMVPHEEYEATLEDYLANIPKKRAEVIRRLRIKLATDLGINLNIQYFSQIQTIDKNMQNNPEKNPLEWLLLLQKYPKELLNQFDVSKILEKCQMIYQEVCEEYEIEIPKKIPEGKAETKPDELTMRMERITDRLNKLPFLFLIGPSGTGKTTTILKELPNYLAKKTEDSKRSKESTTSTEKATDEIRTFITTPPILENIRKWAKADDDSMKILFIDEANLASEKLYAFIEGIFKDPPEIIYGDERIILTNKHKIVFAGNYQHYEKRFLDPLFLKYDCVEHFPRFSPDYELKYQVYPAIESAFKTTELKTDKIDYPNKVMAIFASAFEYCKTLVGPEKITVRNLQAMALAFEVLWKNISLISQFPNERTRVELFAKWAFFQNARDVLGNKAELLKEKLFPKDEELDYRYDRIKTIFPRITSGLRAELYITSPHKRALAVLQEELAVRDIRSNMKNSLGLSCGTRGILLEGAPGIGKSSVVINHLRQLGYVKVPSTSHAEFKEIPPKIYYHITPMPPLQMQKILIDAFHEGAIVVIDELNALPLEGLLNSLMMGVDLEGRRPNREGFYVIGTQNPISLGNRQALSPATENRFRKIHMPDYTENALKKLLQAMYKWAPPEMINYFCKKYATAKANHSPYNFRDLKSDLEYAHVKYKEYLITAERTAATSAFSDLNYNDLSILDFLSNLPSIEEINKIDNNGNTMLSLAIADKNWTMATILLRIGADPYVITPSQQNSLFIAIKNQNIEGVAFLLQHKVDPNRLDDAKTSSLLAAVNAKNKEIIKLLLENGTNPNETDPTKISPLLRAVREQNQEIVELLLEFKASPNEIGLNTSPLLAAVIAKDKEIIKLLLKNGANPNETDPTKISPLLNAVQGQNKEIVELLLEFKANPNEITQSNISPLFVAVQNKDLELIKLLLDKGATPNFSFLDFAIHDQNEEMVRLLLPHIDSYDLNRMDDSGNYPLLTALKNNNKNIVKLLLSHGADPQVFNKEGVSPLLLAVQKREWDIVELCLKTFPEAIKDLSPIFSQAETAGIKAILNLNTNLTTDIQLSFLTKMLNENADIYIVSKQSRKEVEDFLESAAKKMEETDLVSAKKRLKEKIIHIKDKKNFETFKKQTDFQELFSVDPLIMDQLKNIERLKNEIEELKHLEKDLSILEEKQQELAAFVNTISPDNKWLIAENEYFMRANEKDILVDILKNTPKKAITTICSEWTKNLMDVENDINIHGGMNPFNESLCSIDPFTKVIQVKATDVKMSEEYDNLKRIFAIVKASSLDEKTLDVYEKKHLHTAGLFKQTPPVKEPEKKEIKSVPSSEESIEIAKELIAKFLSILKLINIYETDLRPVSFVTLYEENRPGQPSVVQHLREIIAALFDFQKNGITSNSNLRLLTHVYTSQLLMGIDNSINLGMDNDGSWLSNYAIMYKQNDSESTTELLLSLQKIVNAIKANANDKSFSIPTATSSSGVTP